MANAIGKFLAAISQNLQANQICRGPQDLAHYGQDWSKVVEANPSAILFPSSTQEVSEILKAASQFSIAIVPSGGRTGLSAGAVATNHEVVLSLKNLNLIGPIHQSALTLKVGAGAITQAVHEFCEPQGLTWPVDFASKGSSCVGGNIATNAGGVRVIKYGNTRNWVLGLTAVTMDGTIHHFNGDLEKNNTGYDFRQLLIGSEGTLAVITEATLKLTPLPKSRLVFFFSLKNFSAVVDLFSFARKRISNLSAYECFDRPCFDIVLKHFKMASPIKTSDQAFVLMEIENSSAQEADLFREAETWLSEIFESGLVVDGVMAKNEKEAKELWKIREGIAESIFSGHEVHQEDVSVPISRLREFYSEIHERYHKALPDFPIFFFGHIGDGNIHIFIQKPVSSSQAIFLDQTKKADLELFKVLAQYQGSVSAEHGIGILKKHALPFSRSAEEIAIMRSVKKAFDPLNLLNPGKMI